MKVKEQIKNIIKEHKFLKEQLVSEIMEAIDNVEDDKFKVLVKEVFGMDMEKEDFKKKMAEGQLDIDKVNELGEKAKAAVSEVPEAEPETNEEGEGEEEPESEETSEEEGMDKDEDDTMQESDGTEGDHQYDSKNKEKPVDPKNAGAGTDGVSEYDQEKKPPVKPQKAGDDVEGDHKPEKKKEQVSDDEEEETYGYAGDEKSKKEGEDSEDEDKGDMEKLREEMDDMLDHKEAVEGDMMALLKDLIAKVHELENKLVSSGEGEAEETAEEPAEEPQPPVTQEGMHGVKPLYQEHKENANIARSVGKSFFDKRSKR